MKNQVLQYRFVLRVIAPPKGKVTMAKGKAKVLQIKQRGPYRKGRWGLANKRSPKIYIIKHDEEIIYVGITESLLSSRLRSGLTAVGKKGYYGYPWKILAKRDDSRVLDLFVYLFNSKERTEVIEAEVVYLIRSKTGRWPKYQTEIHFHYDANRKEKGIARRIYNRISASHK